MGELGLPPVPWHAALRRALASRALVSRSGWSRPIIRGSESNTPDEVLEPHVKELVVVGVGKSRVAKSDKHDAFGLAEQLRIGSFETRVYKGRGKLKRLGSLAKASGFLVGDVVRVKNRLKSVLRSRGVGYGAGQSVYAKREREHWLGELRGRSGADPVGG